MRFLVMSEKPIKLTEQQQLQLAPRIALVASQLPLDLLVDSLLFFGFFGQAALHGGSGMVVT